MNCRFGILLLAAISLSCSVFSQGSKVFTRVGVGDGLSQSEVRAIEQDSHGFMWFGTKDGLNRYDGREMRVYRPESDNARGLGSGSINDLSLDRENRLWVSTLNGLYLYQHEIDTFVLFEPVGKVTVHTFLHATDGSYWIGTPDELFHYYPDSDELRRYTHNEEDSTSLVNNVVRVFAEDVRGTIWIGTDAGMCIFDAASDGFSRLGEANGFGGFWVQSLVEDKWGRMWIGTNEGVYLSDILKVWDLGVKSVLKTRGQSLAFDSVGDLWIGHGAEYGLTVLHVDPKTGELGTKERYQNRLHDARSLSADGVQSVKMDSTGGVWIGTYSDGLSYNSASRKKFDTMKISNADPDLNLGAQVNAILVDGSEEWIGTEKGLVRFNSENGQYRQYLHDADDVSSLGGNAVYAITRSSTGDIWVGAWNGGLNRYDRSSDSFVRYSHDVNNPNSLSDNNVFSIFEDDAGYLWIGTIGGGLNRFDPQTERVERFSHDPLKPESINSQYINDIEQDSGGVFWISTYSSLDRYDPRKGYFEHFSHTGDANSLNQGDLQDVYIDSRGQLWLGTEVGLAFFDPELKSYRRFTVRDGLPSSYIQSISEDKEGNLWLATNLGLSKFVDGTRVPSMPTFVNFGESDGLQGDEFVKRSNFVSDDGTIYVGGVSGLTRFRPEDIKPKVDLPQVLITNLNILNRKVFPSAESQSLPVETYLLDQVNLSYKDSVFGFSFSALLYPKNTDVDYAYMLDGFDSEWQFVKHATSAIYTNIDPGSYVFRVKSSNEDGFWGGNESSIRVEIAPPWWMTVWFRALCALVFSFALFAIYTWRVFALKKSREFLAEKVEERTHELGQAKEELGVQNEELKLHRNHLEALVGERTRDLELAKDKAEVSDRLKSAFIANMSHEIRTPLNAIMGFSQLIAMEAKNQGEFDSYCESMRENSEMLVQLLNDIIDFSIIESERLQLYPEQIDAWMFFHELSVEISQMVENRTGEQVSYNVEDQLPIGVAVQFVSDKVRLRQILFNLTTNACKFTESGSVSFGVGLNSAKDELCFWVKDTGIGIEPSKQEAIFERFYKIVDPNKSFVRGTGLGLAISKRLAEELGFRLRLDSSSEEGSVFSVTIPVRKITETDRTMPQRTVLQQGSGSELLGKTFLVAEDIASNFTVLEKFLTAAGASLIHARDGQEALRLFEERKDKIDLLLFDISMPKMGGVELLSLIRERDSEIPAIAVTAHAFRGEVDELIAAGFQLCLTKPVDRTTLLEAISQLLQLERP